MATSFDDGFDLDQGGHREEQGVLMSLDQLRRVALLALPEPGF
jgi:hypothetical protein